MVSRARERLRALLVGIDRSYPTHYLVRLPITCELARRALDAPHDVLVQAGLEARKAFAAELELSYRSGGETPRA